MGRQRLVDIEAFIDAVEHLTESNDMPPTIDELRRELRVGSTRTVLRYLRDAQRLGRLDRWPGARGMRLRHGKPLVIAGIPVKNSMPRAIWINGIRYVRAKK